MSVQNAQVFRDRLITDAAFRAAYVRADKCETRKQLLIDAGYNFSHEKIESVMDHASFQRSFSEDELEALTGSRTEKRAVDAVLACGISATGM